MHGSRGMRRQAAQWSWPLLAVFLMSCSDQAPTTFGGQGNAGAGGSGIGGSTADGGAGSVKTDYTDAHDPARMVQQGDRFVVYSSGIESVYLDPAVGKWQQGPGFDEGMLRGDDRPDWIDGQLGDSIAGDPLEIGAAPGMHGPRTMYYCVTDWELDEGSACIGRATATGEVPDQLHWVDDGQPVICSTALDAEQGGPFAIDPSVFESSDERLWLVYGSHQSGIWMVELDPATGHLVAEAGSRWSSDNAAFHRIAWQLSDESAVEPSEWEDKEAQGLTGIEAAFVYPYGAYYYLFVNWGRCCNGVTSNYNLRVGRASAPLGPYFDRQGVDLLLGGGTLLLPSDAAPGQSLASVNGTGRFIGPGHAGVFAYSSGTDEKHVLTFHFYDAEHGVEPGTGTLGARMLTWDEAGWPVVQAEPFAP